MFLSPVIFVALRFSGSLVSLLVRSRPLRGVKERGVGGGKKIGVRKTFGGVGSFVFAEPGEVFVLDPRHVGVVVGVVFLARPVHRCVILFILFFSLVYAEIVVVGQVTLKVGFMLGLVRLVVGNGHYLFGGDDVNV